MINDIQLWTWVVRAMVTVAAHAGFAQTAPETFMPTGHYYFASPVPNTLLSTRRHELWLSGAAHGEGSRQNRSFSILYAPLPAIQLYAASFNGKHRQEFGQPFDRFQSWEAGLGSGLSLTPYFFMGLKGAAGASRLNPTFSDNGRNEQLKFRHVALQAEMAFQTNYFDMGAGWRHYWVRYTEASLYFPADSRVVSNFQYLELHNTVQGGDWLFFVRTGWPFLKLEMTMRMPAYLKPSLTRDKNTFTLSLMLNPVGFSHYWRDHFGKKRLL